MKCAIEGCTMGGRFTPVLSMWPKRGPLKWAAKATMIYGLEHAVCGPHTALFEAGLKQVDWKHIVALARKQGGQTPDKQRVVFQWVKNPKFIETKPEVSP